MASLPRQRGEEPLNSFFKRCFPNKPPCGSLDFQLLVAEHLPQPGKLLDVGCGDNALLERHRTPAVEVWGTDFAAHPQLKHTDWFRPLYRDGSLPFADQTFDVVTASWSWNTSRPHQILAEITACLPGGVRWAPFTPALHHVDSPSVRRRAAFVGAASRQTPLWPRGARYVSDVLSMNAANSLCESTR